MSTWVEQSKWVGFLCENPSHRSPTSVCLKLTDPDLTKLDKAAQDEFCKKLTTMLEKEKAAYDVGAYRDAPPGLRIWCGATIEASDLKTLTAWLDWAYGVCKAEMK